MLILSILINFLKKNYLTVSVVPVISTNNLVSPLVAGPKTNDPSGPKVDPCAEHKNDDFVLLYSTVAAAWGQTEDTAKKLPTIFPDANRIKMIPSLAIKSLIAFTSVSNLTVNTFEPGLSTGLGLGVETALGAGAASLEQAAAKQETHTEAKLPVTVVKNLALFI